MSKTPNFDAKIKAILDATTPGERTCELLGESWELTDEELAWCRHFNVPPSKRSQLTRWKTLAYYTTGFQFWWNKHAETGKPILTFHHPGSGVRVLPDQEWLSKDFSEIVMDYHPDRSFFEQMRELQLRIPCRSAYNTVEPENSIALVSISDKNSYFVLACKSISCFYSTVLTDGEDTSEAVNSSNITSCHNVMHCQRMFRCQYVRESMDCLDSAFLFDCRNCKNCFGATNKRNREYIFFNEQLSKDAYEKRMEEIDLGKRSVVETYSQKFDELLGGDTVWPEGFIEKCGDSTGEYLAGATNCHNCYYSEKNAKDCFWAAWPISNCERCVFTLGMWSGSTDIYHSMTQPMCSGMKFSWRCNQCQDCEYCMMCQNCTNCFGCIGLNRKEFCIFNKQYSEEAYWKKLDEVKCHLLDRGEYGEFFPVLMSTAYSPECGAVEYCGATENDLKAMGGQWFPVDALGALGEVVDPSTIVKAKDVPDSIDDVGEEWVGRPIYDGASERKFAFLRPEIEHYRKLRVAPPTKHIVRRMNELVQSGQLAAFEMRACSGCGKEIRTSKNVRYPDRKIYCRACYLHYLEQHG